MGDTNKKTKVLIACITDATSAMENMIPKIEKDYGIEKILLLIPPEEIIEHQFVSEDESIPYPADMREVNVNQFVKQTLGIYLTEEELNEKKKDHFNYAMLNYKTIQKIKIIEDTDLSNFDETMRKLNEIIEEEKEKGSVIFSSIHDGSPEYIASVSILSMMNEIPIISKTSISFKSEGKFNGLLVKSKENTIIKPLKIPKPDIFELKCLKVFDSFENPGERSNNNVVKKMIWTGLWNEKITGQKCEDLEHRTKNTSFYKVPYNEKNNQKIKPYEATKYHRNYISVWNDKDHKWIEKIRYSDKYKTTDEAKRFLHIFCSNSIFDIDKELNKVKKNDEEMSSSDSEKNR